MSRLWALIPVIVLAELYFGWFIPRREPREEDWKDAAEAIEREKKTEDLVLIAPAWATQGRVYLGHLMTFEDFGRIDTSKYRRIFEISAGGARAPETEDFVPKQVLRFGRLRVSQYDLPPPAKVLYDFRANWGAAVASGFRKSGPRIIIDHWFNPRYLIPLPLSKRPASLVYKNVPQSGILKVYGVVGYRSGRFNKGGPMRITVFVNGAQIGDVLIANFGPKKPAIFPMPRGDRGEVRFEFNVKTNPRREFGFFAELREGFMAPQGAK